ncbi:MAG: cysteine desulfuration protein SufE [Rhodobiaceae bacterium]|nr:cysteine desulfuration protein SufE [Rhodobiaceae bacterium]RPF97143.1 MAG: SufE family protein [Rhizobiales bacterium TMED227]|tara:strand:- start:114 stop:545 length:432 start_codon:yes stop_codon:yes gene_type:complete
MPNLEEILDNMEFLENWEDKYKYIIELGQSINNFDDALKNNSTKVNGCLSQVWLYSKINQNKNGEKVLNFVGDSDAFIVKGLIAILIAIYSEKKPSEILDIKHEDIFTKFGLQNHLSPQRSNGLFSMIQRIKDDAHASIISGD